MHHKGGKILEKASNSLKILLLGFSHEIAKKGKCYLNSCCKRFQGVIESWQWKLLWACKPVKQAAWQCECLRKVVSNYSIDQLLFFSWGSESSYLKQNNGMFKRFFIVPEKSYKRGKLTSNSGHAQLHAHVKKVWIFPVFTKIDIIFAFPLFFLKEILVNILPLRSLSKRHSTGKFCGRIKNQKNDTFPIM